jgi:ADP-heptose:LPS heptosyltransferase
VGDHFAKQGIRIVITAGIDEQEHAQLVADCMHGTPRNLAGMLSLGGLTGLLSLATLTISNDTGPLHLANAVGKPTVGLYWIGNLVNFGSLYRRTHVPLVSWTTRCPECNTPSIMGNIPGQNIERCGHVCSFISDIPADDVIISAERLISRQYPDLTRKPNS